MLWVIYGAGMAVVFGLGFLAGVIASGHLPDLIRALKDAWAPCPPSPPTPPPTGIQVHFTIGTPEPK